MSGRVPQAYNPTYSGDWDWEDSDYSEDWDWEDSDSRPAWAEMFARLHSKPMAGHGGAPVIPAMWGRPNRIMVQAGLVPRKVRPDLKNNQHKKDWWNGSSSREHA
jgi:hypothetical protein